MMSASLSPVLAEERCGWLENPTPGNWWLKDAHAFWIIATQGGPVQGIENSLARPRTVSWPAAARMGMGAPASAGVLTFTRKL